MEEKPEKVVSKVVSVDSRVILLAVGVLSFFAIAACAVLMIFYLHASNQYAEQKEITLNQTETITTLTRSLERSDGKLSVYEAFLVNRNSDIVRGIIAKFLRTERKDSTKTTLRQFEGWMLNRGIGGR